MQRKSVCVGMDWSGMQEKNKKIHKASSYGTPLGNVSSIPEKLYIPNDEGRIIFPKVLPDTDDQPIYLTEALSHLLQLRKVKSSSYVKRKLHESIGLVGDDWSGVSDSSTDPEQLLSMLEKSAESLDLMDLAFDSFDVCLQEFHRQLQVLTPKHAIFIEKLRMCMTEFWADSFGIAKFQRQMAIHYLLNVQKRERDMLGTRLEQDVLVQTLREESGKKDDTIRLLEVHKARDKQMLPLDTADVSDGAHKLVTGKITSTVVKTGENHLYKMELKPGSHAVITLNRQHIDIDERSHLQLLGAFENPPTVLTHRHELYVGREYKSGHSTIHVPASSVNKPCIFYALVCCVSETVVKEKVSYIISNQILDETDDALLAIEGEEEDMVIGFCKSVGTQTTSWELQGYDSDPNLNGDEPVLHTQVEHFCSYLSYRPLHGVIWPINLVSNLVWLFWTQKTALLRERDPEVIQHMGMKKWVYQWFLHYFGSANFAIRVMNTFIQSMHYHLPHFTMQSAYFLPIALGTACGIFGSGSKFYRMEYEEFVCNVFDVVLSYTKVVPSAKAEITRQQANEVVNLVFGVDAKNKKSYREGMIESLNNYGLMHNSSTILVDTFLHMLMQEWERYRSHALDAIQYVVVETLHLPLGVCQGVGDLSLILKQVCSNPLCDQRVAAMFVEAMDPRTLEVSASSVVELIHCHKLLRLPNENIVSVPLCKMTPKVDMELLLLTHKIITACIESSKQTYEESLDARKPLALSSSIPADSSTVNVRASSRNILAVNDGASPVTTNLKVAESILRQAQENLKNLTMDNAHASWAVMAKLSCLLPLQVYANETKITSSTRVDMLATLDY